MAGSQRVPGPDAAAEAAGCCCAVSDPEQCGSYFELCCAGVICSCLLFFPSRPQFSTNPRCHQARESQILALCDDHVGTCNRVPVQEAGRADSPGVGPGQPQPLSNRCSGQLPRSRLAFALRTLCSCFWYNPCGVPSEEADGSRLASGCQPISGLSPSRPWWPMRSNWACEPGCLQPCRPRRKPCLRADIGSSQPLC